MSKYKKEYLSLIIKHKKLRISLFYIEIVQMHLVFYVRLEMQYHPTIKCKFEYIEYAYKNELK